MNVQDSLGSQGGESADKQQRSVVHLRAACRPKCLDNEIGTKHGAVELLGGGYLETVDHRQQISKEEALDVHQVRVSKQAPVVNFAQQVEQSLEDLRHRLCTLRRSDAFDKLENQRELAKRNIQLSAVDVLELVGVGFASATTLARSLLILKCCRSGKSVEQMGKHVASEGCFTESLVCRSGTRHLAAGGVVVGEYALLKKEVRNGGL
jgi:hypothetical protein